MGDIINITIIKWVSFFLCHSNTATTSAPRSLLSVTLHHHRHLLFKSPSLSPPPLNGSDNFHAVPTESPISPPLHISDPLTLGFDPSLCIPERDGGREMNPLCCIAPVSIDKEAVNGGSEKGAPSTGKSLSPSHASFLGDSHRERAVSLSPVSGRQHLYSTHLSFSDDYGNITSREGEESAVEGSVNVVAGVLFKWVNYGKGWRPRWFVLRDGVLSYYKVHGPDKIDLVGEFGKVRIIGEESVRRIRKKVVPNQWGSTVSSNNGASIGTVLGHAKKWKSFGEIHLKVSF